MAELQSGQQQSSGHSWRQIVSTEDWWAIWLGLGLVIAAVILFTSGDSIKWIAISPQKWSRLGEAVSQFVAHAGQYLALFVLWAALLGSGARSLGIRLSQFLPAFVFVYVA